MLSRESPPAPDHRDLASLYDAYSAAVYRLALRFFRDTSAAEDLVQDVFLRYWHQDRYEASRGPVLAYLLLLTRSMAINRLNQRSTRLRTLQRLASHLGGSHQRSAIDRAELDELASRMREALARISAPQRQVLELAYFDGMTQSGIAEHLRIPLGTVKTRSRQALLRLREEMHDFAPISCAAEPYAATSH